MSLCALRQAVRAKKTGRTSTAGCLRYSTPAPHVSEGGGTRQGGRARRRQGAGREAASRAAGSAGGWRAVGEAARRRARSACFHLSCVRAIVSERFFPWICLVLLLALLFSPSNPSSLTVCVCSGVKGDGGGKVACACLSFQPHAVPPRQLNSISTPGSATTTL